MKKHKIINIGEPYITIHQLEGFSIFEGSFLCEHDKELIGPNGIYKVLEFKEIYIPKRSFLFAGKGGMMQFEEKHSCLKLNKPVEEGDIFFIRK